MNQLFIVRGVPGMTFEQDVTVTTVTTSDVPVREGDTVEIMVRATVKRVLGVGGDGIPEVELENARAVKVASVKRAGR